MGKALIIKDADFSANALDKIILPYTVLKSVSLASLTQRVVVGSNIIKSKSRVVADMYIPHPSKGTCWFLGTSISSNGSFLLGNSANQFTYAMEQSVTQREAPYISEGRHTLDISNRILVDNIEKVSFIDNLHGDLSDAFRVLSAVSSLIDFNLAVKLYSLKIYNDWEDEKSLVFDIIPVMYNNKACLYDKVSKTYIYETHGESLAYEEVE